MNRWLRFMGPQFAVGSGGGGGGQWAPGRVSDYCSCRSPFFTRRGCDSQLAEALGHKLRVDDVVGSVVGLHHVEAAVAPAAERPERPALDPLCAETSSCQDASKDRVHL